MTNYSSLKRSTLSQTSNWFCIYLLSFEHLYNCPCSFSNRQLWLIALIIRERGTCTSFTRTYVFYSHARGCDRILLSGKNTTGNALSTPGASLITARYDNWGIKDRVICRSTIEWERRGMCFAQGRVFKGLWKRKFVKIFCARKFLIAHFICI